MNTSHVIEVIESLVPRGRGADADPFRTVIQYHTKTGVFLAERDEWLEQHTISTAGLGQD